jgi:hypothetical protein
MGGIILWKSPPTNQGQTASARAAGSFPQQPQTRNFSLGRAPLGKILRIPSLSCFFNLGILQSASAFIAWPIVKVFQVFLARPDFGPMPPRHITLAIIAFWVAMSGWLFYSELWPWLRPGEPPPYVIDLVDEARFREAKNNWIVLENGRDIGYADTWVDFRESDDTFRLNEDFKIWGRERRGDAHVEMISMYRVTRRGELREVAANVKILPGFVPGLNFEGAGSVAGKVRDGKLGLHLHCKIPLFVIDKDLEPVTVANRGSVLNPMQPLNRLRGLRPDQHWQIALFDPMSAVLASLVPSAAPRLRILSAKVREETINWPQESADSAELSIPCLVIDYAGDDSKARTWVRQSDGTVLQQEASFGGRRLTLRRSWMGN